MGTRKTIGISLLAAAAVLHVSGNAAYAEEPKNKEALKQTDRVIVTLEQGVSKAAFSGAASNTLDIATDSEMATVAVPENMDLDSFVAELGEQPGVASVEPDHLSSTTNSPNDPYYSLQYHHEVIGSERAWQKTTGSPDVVVAVLDNGFDLDHPELKDQIVSSHATAPVMSEDAHGTHVAGIIGAAMNNNTYGTGIAPNAGIMAVDVFEGELAYTSDIIEGIYHAADAGADIINLSLGNYVYSETYEKAIRYAHERGVLVVAAAGNEYTTQSHYPSGYKNVISVGSTDHQDRLSSFSNHGAAQDITAPGSDIWSTTTDGSFMFMSGTSMASPVVAGVAALMKSSQPDLTNVEIEQRLYKTAVDFGAFGKDKFYGHGRIDAEAALAEVDRISGTDRFKTAIATSKKGWDSADTVVLSTGADFPDALAGGPLAYKEDAPILLTRSRELQPETKQEIKRLGASKVIILGGNGAVSTGIQAELGSMGLSVERIGGKTRFETASMIAGELDSDQAVVAFGFNFPDVLSVSPYAAKNGVPILLTRPDRLPDETAAALAEVSSTYVIGGKGAVSDQVFAGLPNPERFGGKNRYETGYEVATGLALGTDKAYIATGLNFPDALTGSVLAAKHNAPILLVRADYIPEATERQLSAYGDFSIFGGIGAVSDDVKALLENEL